MMLLKTTSNISSIFKQALNVELWHQSMSRSRHFPIPWRESFVQNIYLFNTPGFQYTPQESQMMRYIKSLENKDLSPNTWWSHWAVASMKLNAATELIPVSWPELTAYILCSGITNKRLPVYHFSTGKYLGDYQVWCLLLQPNSGAQGEYAGLLAIRALPWSKKKNHIVTLCWFLFRIGTNPASAIMADESRSC